MTRRPKCPFVVSWPEQRGELSVITIIHLNWLANIELRGPGPPGSQYYCKLLLYECTVARKKCFKKLKKNWPFCHIFIIDGISIGGGEGPLGVGVHAKLSDCPTNKNYSFSAIDDRLIIK